MYLSLAPTLYNFTLTIGLTYMIGSRNLIIWDSTITGYIYSILCAYICFIYILTVYYWFISEGEELRKNNPLTYHCIFICLFIAMFISILVFMFNLNGLFIFICKKLAVSLVDFLLKMNSNPYGGPNWHAGGSNWPSSGSGQPGGPGGPPGGWGGPTVGGDPFSNRREHTRPLKVIMEDWLPNREPSDGLPCPDLLISGQEMRYVLHQKGLDDAPKFEVYKIYESNTKGMKDFLHKWCVDQRFGAYLRFGDNKNTWKELSYKDKLWVRKQVIAEAIEENFYQKQNIDKDLYRRLRTWNLREYDKALKKFQETRKD